MKSFINLFAVVALISSPAFAQSKKKTTVKTATPAAASAPASSAPSYSYSGGSTATKSGPQFSADLGIGTFASKMHFGLGLRMEFPTMMDGNNFSFGGQTGFYLGPSDPSTWVIPILVTGTYHFRTTGTLKPYIGLGMGISLTHYSATSVTILGTTVAGASGSSTDFSIVFKPGFECGDNGKYYFELPLGTTAGTFSLMPTFGMHF